MTNTSPLATIGGPYTINEGSGLTISAAGSSDADGHVIEYAWDIDNDGNFDDGDGRTLSLTWAQLNDIGIKNGTLAARTVSVLVTDAFGNRLVPEPSQIASSTLSITNLAPTATVDAPLEAVEGTDIDVSFNDIVDLPEDVLSFSVDVDGNGLFSDAVDVHSSNPQVTFQFTDNGTRVINLRVADADGGSTVYTRTVNVANKAPIGKANLSSSAIDEGSSITFGVQLADLNDAAADISSLKFAFDMDGHGVFDTNNDGVFNNDDFISAMTQTRSYFVDGRYTLGVLIQDKDGATSEPYTATLDVRNVLPTITAFSLLTPTTPAIKQGDLLQFTGSFTDPANTADLGKWTGVAIIRDAATNLILEQIPLKINQSTMPVNGQVTFSLEHTITQRGNLTVTAMVTDGESLVQLADPATGPYVDANGTTRESTPVLISVTNVAPTIESPVISGVIAGRESTLKLVYADPGDEATAEAWEVDALTGKQKYRAASAGFTFSISYAAGQGSMLADVGPTRVWAFEDELPMNFIKVPVQYSSSGAKTVTVTITDGVASVTKVLTIDVAEDAAPVVESQIPDLRAIVSSTVAQRPFYANLRQVFGDADNLDSELTFAVTSANPLVATVNNAALNSSGDANAMLHLDLMPNVIGSSMITVTATDPQGQQSNATFTVYSSSLGSNSAPIAVADTFSGSTSAVHALTVLANDSDPDNDPITITHVNGVPVVMGTPIQLTLGRLELLSATGPVNFLFFPNGLTGTQQFTYTISDGQLSATTTATLSFAATNRAPVAGNDNFGGTAPLVLEDTPFSGNVQTNDSDADGDVLTSVLLTQPNKGTVSMLANGDFTFNPTANANGLTTFTYRLLDGRGGVANGTVTLNITSVNDAPQGADKTISLTRSPNVPAVDMVFSESDFAFADVFDSPANTASGVKISTLPARGTLSLNGIPVSLNTVVPAASIQNGLLKFAPATNGFGTNYSSFDFQVVDNGGTDNGGVDTDPLANKITFNVTSTDVTGPRINNVYVNSTAWTANFRDLVDNPVPGVLPLNGVGVGYKVSKGIGQTSILPWVNINELLVEFNEDVGSSLSADDFVISGIGGLRSDAATGSIPRVLSMSYSSSTRIARLTLNQSLDPSTLTVTIASSSVFDVSGNNLDGEWTTDASTVSGDGTIGGDFAFTLFVLPGDINRDGFVTTADSDLIPATRNFTNALYSIWGDLNGSQIINADDRDNVARRLGARRSQ